MPVPLHQPCGAVQQSSESSHEAQTFPTDPVVDHGGHRRRRGAGHRTAGEPVQPIEPAKIKHPARVALGEKLWFDPRLSRSGFISCNSCHNLSMGGSDKLKTSIGDKWNKGLVNSPAVLNSSLNLVQFWDGRAKDLQEQAHGPIANPIEMAFTHDLAVDTVTSIPEYRAEFRKLFKSGKLTMHEITLAIAAFEETLVTPHARFDKWLKGARQPSMHRNCAATSCSSHPAAWRVTTARTLAGRRSRRWGWWSRTRQRIRPKAGPA